jgi:hypothetical protein
MMSPGLKDACGPRKARREHESLGEQAFSTSLRLRYPAAMVMHVHVSTGEARGGNLWLVGTHCAVK